MVWLIVIGLLVASVVSTTLFMASRYRRCPPDQILVIYGKTDKDKSCRAIHGGGAMVWPLIQDYEYLLLTPITIPIDLQNALSLQNIRVNLPSTFTIGIGTEPEIMNNAAERLLGLDEQNIKAKAGDIIIGQLRQVIAGLTIEQINQDRESFLTAIQDNVSSEINKIGLKLINVNIQDISDESGYIEAIGRKAAAEAVNQADVDVSEQNKLGEIGQSENLRDQEVRVAENKASSTKGQKKAEADRRVYVQQQEAEAVDGENKAAADIADAQAALKIREATADQRGQVAQQNAVVEIQKAKAAAEKERLTADEVVPREINKRKIEIDAEATAEKSRREAKGEADAILFKYEAEAEGIRKVLEGKAAGYKNLVDACGGDASATASLLMIEKIEEIAKLQVEVLRGITIDKLTVVDSGTGDALPNTVSKLVRMMPGLHDVAANTGVKLPEFLGSAERISKAERSTITPSGGNGPGRK